MKNKIPKPLPLPFAGIQELCACYRGELTLLDHVIAKYNFAVQQLAEDFHPRLQGRAAVINGTKTDLSMAIDANRPLFEKPRTRTFSDIKVGLQKQKGCTQIPDEEKTIALIAKHFPDRLDELAPATRALRKSALATLTAAQLKKIGVEITGDTDEVIIKPMDSDVEKAVAALLKESAPELKQAA